MVEGLELVFPGLRGADWRVSSAPDDLYNCIAWAALATVEWWWPAEPGKTYSCNAAGRACTRRQTPKIDRQFTRKNMQNRFRARQIVSRFPLCGNRCLFKRVNPRLVNVLITFVQDRHIGQDCRAYSPFATALMDVAEHHEPRLNLPDPQEQ
jgi:hypothetical protein